MPQIGRFGNDVDGLITLGEPILAVVSGGAVALGVGNADYGEPLLILGDVLTSPSSSGFAGGILFVEASQLVYLGQRGTRTVIAGLPTLLELDHLALHEVVSIVPAPLLGIFAVDPQDGLELDDETNREILRDLADALTLDDAAAALLGETVFTTVAPTDWLALDDGARLEREIRDADFSLALSDFSNTAAEAGGEGFSLGDEIATEQIAQLPDDQILLGDAVATEVAGIEFEAGLIDFGPPANTSRHYTIPHDAVLDLGSGAWAWGVWTRIDQNAGTAFQYLLSSGTQPAISFNLFLGEASAGIAEQNRFAIRIVDDAAVDTGALISSVVTGGDGVLRLVIVQSTGTTVEMWFCEPGQSAVRVVNAAVNLGVLTAPTVWNFGRRSDGESARYFEEWAGDLFKADAALTQTQIEAIGAGLAPATVLGAACKASWRFLNGTNATEIDVVAGIVATKAGSGWTDVRQAATDHLLLVDQVLTSSGEIVEAADGLLLDDVIQFAAPETEVAAADTVLLHDPVARSIESKIDDTVLLDDEVTGFFSPTDLGADLQLWLSAADVGDFTLDGSAVTQWNDKSGNARHFSQATAAKKPVRNATAFNGQPGVVFDGADDFLGRDATDFMYDLGGCTIVVAIKAAQQATGGRRVLGEGRAGNNTTLYTMFQVGTQGGSLAVIHGAARNDGNITFFNNNDGSTAWGTTAVEQIVSVIDTGTSWGTAINGVPTTPINYTRSGTLTLDTITLGAQRRASEENWLAGTIAEVIVTSDTSVATRQKLEGYLANKYGLQL